MGSGQSWRRQANLLLCFKNTNPTGWAPPWTQSTASIWSWLLWGSGCSPPQRPLQCLLLKTNGAGQFGGHQVAPNKEGLSPSPVPTPSTDPPVPMISFPVVPTGNSFAKRANGVGTCNLMGEGRWRSDAPVRSPSKAHATYRVGRDTQSLGHRRKLCCLPSLRTLPLNPGLPGHLSTVNFNVRLGGSQSPEDSSTSSSPG